MPRKTILLSVIAALAMISCNNSAVETVDKAAASAKNVSSAVAEPTFDGVKLKEVLGAQSDKAKARYEFRHPYETLEFFGITPGMTIADALPGGGWYSKILIPYLGDNGHMIGMDYSLKMWPEFGGFADAEFIEKKKSWATEWVEGAQAWRGGTQGRIDAFTFGSRNTAMDGTVDAVLFIRALHNLARFEDKGNYLSEALQDSHALLKLGGIVGVVQHQGPEDNDDTWAKGDKGYLKKSQLIAKFEAAGFEFVKESAINENPKDVPSNDDIVWRLPPSLGTSKDNPDLKAKMQAIGESNRMTLLFKKN